MKTKRFVITIALIFILACMVAIPVFAGYFYISGTYNGYTYEVMDSCGANSYSSTTLCDSDTYPVKSDVYLFGRKLINHVTYKDQLLLTVNGTAVVRSSTTSGAFYDNVDYMKAQHFVNGVVVYYSNVTAG